MRAVVVREWGGPEDLVWGELPTPEPGAGELRVRVAAAGVNHADLLLIAGRYQVRPELPFAPGYEVAGIVDAVGAGVPPSLVGTRVAAYSGFGGAFAEWVVIPAVRAIPIPDSLPAAEAAVLPATFGTGVHALFDRGRLQAEETLVVLGAAGGVGSAAIQLGAAAGATVVAAVSSAPKGDWARRMGAKDIIRYDRESLRDRIDEVTAGRGADVVFDPVGGDSSEAALRSLAWDGRLLVIGYTAGSIPEIPTNLALLKSVSIVGVFWGAYVQREPDAVRVQAGDVIERMAAGELRPVVTQTLPVNEVQRALEIVAARDVIGRIALVFE